MDLILPSLAATYNVASVEVNQSLLYTSVPIVFSVESQWENDAIGDSYDAFYDAESNCCQFPRDV